MVYIVLFIMVLVVGAGLVFITEYISYKTNIIIINYFNTSYMPYRESDNKLKRNGFSGEARAKRFLANLVDKRDIFVTNLLIPKDDGFTTEIDCVLISRKGIFCFEVKNWIGRVNGFECDDFWYRKYMTRHSKAKQIKNPVKQNETHVRAINKVLGYEYFVHNVVLFSQDITLEHIVSNCVYTRSMFEQYYKSLKKNVFSRRKTYELIAKLVIYKANEDKMRLHEEQFKRKYDAI